MTDEPVVMFRNIRSAKIRVCSTIYHLSYEAKAPSDTTADNVFLSAGFLEKAKIFSNYIQMLYVFLSSFGLEFLKLARALADVIWTFWRVGKASHKFCQRDGGQKFSDILKIELSRWQNLQCPRKERATLLFVCLRFGKIVNLVLSPGFCRIHATAIKINRRIVTAR